MFLGLNLRWDQAKERDTKGADPETRPGQEEKEPESSQDEEVVKLQPQSTTTPQPHPSTAHTIKGLYRDFTRLFETQQSPKICCDASRTQAAAIRT